MQVIFEEKKLRDLLLQYAKARRNNVGLKDKTKLYVELKEVLDLNIIEDKLIMKINSELGVIHLQSEVPTEFAARIVELFSSKLVEMSKQVEKIKDFPDKL